MILPMIENAFGPSSIASGESTPFQHDRNTNTNININTNSNPNLNQTQTQNQNQNSHPHLKLSLNYAKSITPCSFTQPGQVKIDFFFSSLKPTK